MNGSYPVELIEIGRDMNTGKLIAKTKLDKLARGWAKEDGYIFTGPNNDYRVIDSEGLDITIMFAYELRKLAFCYQTE